MVASFIVCDSRCMVTILSFLWILLIAEAASMDLGHLGAASLAVCQEPEAAAAKLIQSAEARVAALEASLDGPDVAAVLASIPSGAALVDFLVGTNVYALVMARGQPVQVVSLGQAASLHSLQEALLRFEIGRGGRSLEESKADAEPLIQVLWDPIAQHLHDIDTVLVCPDGFLGKLPFGTAASRPSGEGSCRFDPGCWRCPLFPACRSRKTRRRR